MASTDPPDPKLQALRAYSALHPRPGDVKDPLFQDSEFFDPRDLVQVKYEMLRRVEVDREPITHAAAAFGFSRPSFYQARTAYEGRGLPGLVPRKRGPRGAHKLTDEIVRFIQAARAKDQSLRAPALADLVHEQFGVRLHPRTIERRLRQEKKLRRSRTQGAADDEDSDRSL